MNGYKKMVNVKLAALDMKKADLCEALNLEPSRVAEAMDETNRFPKTDEIRQRILYLLDQRMESERKTSADVAFGQLIRGGMTDVSREEVSVVMPSDMLRTVTVKGEPVAFMTDAGLVKARIGGK